MRNSWKSALISSHPVQLLSEQEVTQKKKKRKEKNFKEQIQNTTKEILSQDSKTFKNYTNSPEAANTRERTQIDNYCGLTAKLLLKMMGFVSGKEWDLPYQVSDFIYKALVLRGHGFSTGFLLNQQDILENPERDTAWSLDF